MRADGNRLMLENAEEELRRDILAEKAGVKKACQWRQRAEINVERWRRRCLANEAKVKLHFGMDDEQEGLR